MNQPILQSPQFYGFEYTEITTARELEPVYTSSYPSFGWTLERARPLAQGGSAVQLTFKRQRRLPNKAQMVRLQREFDSGMEELRTMKRAKARSAACLACLIGLLGLGCLAGALFAQAGGRPALCAVLAVPGVLSWVISFLTYRRVSRRRAEELTPAIERKYAQLQNICAQAGRLTCPSPGTIL